MGITDSIIKALEESVEESGMEGSGILQAPAPEKSSRKRTANRKPGMFAKKPGEFDMVGYTIGWPPITWDEIGLGLVHTMGFIHNKPVKLSYRSGTWSISGPFANSTVMWFVFAGGGTLVYFLWDTISRSDEWGSILGGLLPVVFSILGLLFRKKTLEFKPYEIEMLAYDSENHVLVLSILTEPGGVIAIRPDLPSDQSNMKAAEENLTNKLREIFYGFFRIDGLAKPDYSAFKSWSLWAFMTLMIGYFSYRYFY
ncbi:MAG: hypothetical protein NTY09_11700 [bacterium]|nr:hypothetical protein [bacterium]